jgi:hypothetical protein
MFIFAVDESYKNREFLWLGKEEMYFIVSFTWDHSKIVVSEDKMGEKQNF